MDASKGGGDSQFRSLLTEKAKIQMLGFYYSLYASFQVLHYKAQLHLLSEPVFSSPLSKELIRYQQIMLLRRLQRHALLSGFQSPKLSCGHQGIFNG